MPSMCVTCKPTKQGKLHVNSLNEKGLSETELNSLNEKGLSETEFTGSIHKWLHFNKNIT